MHVQEHVQAWLVGNSTHHMTSRCAETRPGACPATRSLKHPAGLLQKHHNIRLSSCHSARPSPHTSLGIPRLAAPLFSVDLKSPPKLTMAEQLSTPRITASYLDSFVGRVIMLVGKVTQLRGDQATLDSDGTVTVLLNRVSGTRRL